jgi:putative ABC transport system substrate-binding protein
MNRRAFIVALGSAAAWPVVARAQQPVRVPRIGYMVTGSLEMPASQTVLEAFRQGLRQLGYVDGQNILIEYREAHGHIERFSNLAMELVNRNVDLIVAGNTPAALAARQATTTIPIVVQVMGDPVRDGLVASLSRPGGNVTGLTFLGPELTAKRLQLLKDILPTISRVAVLWHPGAYGADTMQEMLNTTEAGAKRLSLQLEMIEARSPEELDDAFTKLSGDRTEAVLVFPSPMFYNYRQRLGALALSHGLPSIYVDREFVELGGLMAYGTPVQELSNRSATFVDKILKGAKPGDLPIEQPTKFALTINLKTAKALGIVIPPPVLARADEVIE